MSDGKIAVNRSLVGVLAAIFLLLGAAVWAFGSGSSSEEGFYAASLRMGLLLGAFWVALPTKNRAAAWANVSPWTFVGSMILIFLTVRRPRVFLPLLIGLALVAYFIRPRKR
ncbi:MAG: hypothetical protein R3C01_18455 [Planctomycetaceae bacterium]